MANGRLGEGGGVVLFIRQKGIRNDGTQLFRLTNCKAPRGTFCHQNSFLLPRNSVNPKEWLINDKNIPSLNILCSPMDAPTSNGVRGS